MAALPVLQYNWWSRVNLVHSVTANVNDSLRNSVFFLKSCLTNECVEGTASTSVTRSANSIWTVVSSSDGTSSATGDLWGTTFDSSKIIKAVSTSPHSWIILENSYIGYQMLIDVSSGNSGRLRIAFTTSSAPWNSPLVTSPTQSAFSWALESADATNVETPLFQDGTSPSRCRSHISINEKGEFFFFSSRDGTNVFNMILMFRELSSSTPVPYGYASAFAPYNYSTDLTSNLRGVFPYGIDTAAGTSAGAHAVFKFGGTHVATVGTSSVDNKYKVFPYISSLAAPSYNSFCRLPDLYMMSYAPTGASIPNTSSQTHIVYSNGLSNGSGFIIPVTDVIPDTT